MSFWAPSKRTGKKLIEYKLALKAKMQELADSRKRLSFSELTAESEKYLSSAQIGDGKGQYPKEAVETFRKSLKPTAAAGPSMRILRWKKALKPSEMPKYARISQALKYRGSFPMQ